jgi:uncharacterized membrane protein HdeD (DUF308 family)
MRGSAAGSNLRAEGAPAALQRPKEDFVSSPAFTPGVGGVQAARTEAVEAELPRMWWLWVVVGTAWSVAALVILQFDEASVRTVGIIIGCMFLFSSAQQFLMAALAERLRWLWAVFAALFLVAGILCFIEPEKTFAGVADILGFLFLVVGIWWTLGAFLEREVNPLWWVSLLSGILMIVLAFWTSGQFFIQKAYTLLVFAGIWALMHGITDIIRGFQMRSLRDRV